MTREDREVELNAMTRYPAGRVRLLEAFAASCDASGTAPRTIFRSMDEMIQLILKTDFPEYCYENPITNN